MSEQLTVYTGATGQQVGAVVKTLLERGHEVRAVTRNTDSEKARALTKAGVTLVRAHHLKTRPRSRNRSKERPPSSR
jgi:nucleoside-diphosphate-sugar epimerase